MADFDTEFASFRGQKPQADGATFDDEFSAFRQTKEREQAALRTSVGAAMQTTPEQAAKVKYLSTVTGIDPSVVATQEGEVAARAKFQEIQKEARFSPVLQARLRDPEFTKLAIDDVPTLSKLEQGIGGVMQFAMGADGKGGLPGMVERGAKKAYYGSVSGTSGAFRAVSEFAAPVLDPLENVQSIGGNPLRRLAEGFGLIAQGANANSDAVKSPYDGNIAAGAESGFTSLGQNAKYAPFMLAGPAGVAAALVGMSLETGGQSYQQAREKGINQNAALMYGASDAVVEFATEKIPMHRLIGDVAANTGVFKTVAKQIGLEVPGEQIATALQDLNEWAVMHPEKTFGDYIAARPDAAIQTLVATVIGTGGNVAVGKALGTLMGAQVQRDYNDLFNAQREAQDRAAKLQDVMATAAGSKLRELSPETFRDHVQAAADGQEGAPKSVHIDGQVLLQTLQAAGVTEEQLAQSMPSVVAQLAEAATANSTVEIPIGELATALPGTPLEQALLPHLRIGGPESLSQSEAEQAQQQAQEYLKGEAERVVQESQDQVQWTQESEGIKSTIRDQLTATGRFSDDVNGKYATLVRDFYSVMASRTGMTPKAMYDLMPYKVGVRGQSGAVLDTMRQGGTAYPLAPQSEWYGEGTYAADGGRMVSVTPDEYLDAVRPLVMDEESRENIDLLKEHIKSGKTLDPLLIRANGKEDGRHRAYAAKELGIKSVPVIAYGDRFANASEYGQDALNQESQAPKLMAVHNLSIDNLLYADKMGGLAVPSVGVVTDQAGGVEGFGEITLIGRREMVDPKSERVFSSDAYTMRFPRPEYAKAKSKDAMKLVEKVRAVSKEFDDRSLVDVTFDSMVNTPKPDEVVSKWLRSNATKALYLREQGTEVAPVTAPVRLESGLTVEQYTELRPLFDQAMAAGVEGSPEEKELQAKIEATLRENYKALGKREVLVDKLVSHAVNQYEYVMGKDARAIEAGPQVDSGKTSEALDAALKGKEAEFKAWVEDQIMPKFGEPFLKVGSKKLPYTLPNIVDAMTDSKVKGKEKTMTYGPGQVRAAASVEFSNLEQMREAAKTSIADPEVYKVAKEQSEKLLSDYREAVAKYTTIKNWRGEPDVWEAMDGSMRALAKWATSKKQDATTMKAALKAEDFNTSAIPAELIQQAITAGRALLDAPVPYFEAKPQRAVNLDEFAGAVVPASTPKEALDVLSKNGIAVKVLTPEQDRTQAAKAFAAELSAQGEQTLFQNTQPNKYQAKYLAGRDLASLNAEERAQYDILATPSDNLAQPQAQGPRGTFNPSTLTTVLNENADLSTFLHETGHFFLEAMATLASQPNADPGVVKDMNALLKWFGVPDLSTWQGYTLEEQRKHHERFAESFELYLMEGKAPNTELAQLFRTFRAWLTRVYKSLSQFMEGRDLQFSDDIRQVMDRMLATEAQIAEAEKVAGLVPNLDATGEAIEQLQSRSIRDLKWAVNARNKFIKQLQQEAKAKRKEVEAEVTAEVDAMPEFAAKKALDDLRKATKEKPSDADLAAIADAHGFKDYESMLSAIDAVGKKADVIEGMTDQRMLERYGDLVDKDSIEQAATEAVHNAARAKSLATELAAQRELLNPRQDTGKTNVKGQKITVNALAEAAKQFAANVVGRKPVGELKKAAYNHLQAERRAAKAWEAATAKGDTKAAVQAKQDQMLNNATVRAANEAIADAKKTMEFFAKVLKGNSETVVEKGRDADIVNAARAILAVYGVGTFQGKNAFEYLDLLKANDPSLFAVLDDSVRAAVASAKPVGKLTVDELTALKDEIASMWHLAKSSRQYEVDGDRMDIEDAAEELKVRMEAKGVPAVMPGDFGAVTEAEKRGRSLQFAGALLRRVESWAEGMDGKFGGPFLKLVFQPVKGAADRYRADRAAYRKQFTALVENVSPSLKPGLVEAPELGYTFGKGKGGVGQAELLSAMLHLGNGSNKRKLLLGRNWATENEDGTLDTSRWDAFMARMHNTGVVNKAHYGFAQGVWDLLESMKPLAQKTHRDVYGRYFAEVTANTLDTPFGPYKGGYVPAQVDPEIVKDNELRKLAEVENENMSYAFPATNKGFTKGRTEYNRPLMLDLRTLPQHIDKVLLFSHMEPAVRGVSKVLSQRGVSSMLGKIDPAAIGGMLTPWLNRSARQIVETPIVGDGRISRVLSVVRARAGMSVMFANLSNTVQQLAGLTLARVKIKRGYLLPAMAQYTRNPKKMSDAVAAASSFMATRMDDQIAALNGTVDEILLNPSVYESAKNWTAKHTYFLQSALDNVVGPVVWSAAYNQALADGMSEKDAVHFADGTVRQTQGSTLPEDVSRIETGPSYARIFTQFIGYFNMVANTNVTALKNIADDAGLKRGAGKALAVLFFGLLAPAWIAEAIAQAFKGGPDDEDKDGSYIDDWLMAVFGLGTVKTVLAGVPFVGQFAMAGLNTWNGKPYDDRTNLSPAVSMLEGAVGAPHSVYKALVENGSKQKAVRDVATAVSLATGLPVSAAARPLGYLTGVADSKVNPTGPVDAVRGVVTGTASPESKR